MGAISRTEIVWLCRAQGELGVELERTSADCSPKRFWSLWEKEGLECIHPAEHERVGSERLLR